MTLPELETRLALRRVGAVCAFAGPLLLLASTLMHPMGEDPNDSVAAFAEYAADRRWVWTHLGQFGGFALTGAALVALSAQLEAGWAAAWGRIGIFAAGVSVAVAAALQAVDGIALKAMVDRLAAADGATRPATFEAAFAVRQIEIGLAGLLSVSFGLALFAFAAGLGASAKFPRWFAVVAALAGIGTFAAGCAQSASGFSALSMNLSLASSVIALGWGGALGVLLLRKPADR